MTEKPTVVELLSKVMDAVQAVGKKQRNLEQNYSFRGVDAVVNAVGPELRKQGVVVIPVLQEAAYRDVTTSRGKPSRECTVKVCYRFYGPAGDHIEAVVPGESMDFGDKGAAKAMSVAYRIALLQALCIPTDEPEPDSHTYERAHDEWETARPATKDQPTRPNREFIIAKASAAIAKATTKPELDALGLLVTERETEQAISGSDAIDLRRQIVARLDVLFPAGEQHVVKADQRQHRRMHALWREIGLGGQDNREKRLARTSEIVGRNVDSSADLLADEAEKVIDVLDAERRAGPVEPQGGAT